MTVPQDLIERVKAAAGPDTEIDEAIDAWLYRSGGKHHGDLEYLPRFTASVDAALALVERVLPGWHWNIGHDANGELHATIWHGVTEHDEYAPTAPLAIVLAVLTALQSSEQSK